MEVAVLGTGIMGLPMARNMRAAGLEVRAWNRTREKAEPLAGDGATVVDDPAEAVRGADVVVTMLRDADAVVAVMEDAVGSMDDGAVWLQMSTIGVAGTERCATLASEHSLPLVDAPVSGTKKPAEEGKLVVLASGDDAAIDRCAPVLDAVGQKTVRLGEAGEGTRLKLVLNHWLLGLVECVAGTVAFAEGVNVDPARFLETIEGGPLDAAYAQMKGRQMIERDFPASFALDTAHKDAELVIEAAERHDVELPLVAAVEGRMRRAVELGYGDKDMGATFMASEPA